MKKFFGSDKKGSKDAQAENPYAQEPANDPYANVPVQPRQSRPGGLPSGPGGGLPSGPRAGRSGVGLPSGPGPRQNSGSSISSAPPPYQTQAPSPQPQQQSPPQQSSGYSSDRYGAQAGYGGNRYGDGGYPNEKGRGSAPPSGPRPGARGPGGYGGMGSNDAEGGRDALFGGGRERYAANQQNAQNNGYGGGYSDQSSGYGGSQPSASSNKYGGYGEERELTEEERIKLEERDLARQIDEERNATVDTGYRILGVLNNTIETASGTMQNLAQQDERLRNTERNLDLANIHNRTAEERTKELKYYNRSLWKPGNPFMSKSRAAEREAKMLSQHQQDRVEREAQIRDAADSQQKYERGMRDIERDMASRKALGLSASETAASNNKFVFDESDDEDGNAENQMARADRRAKEAEINNVLLPQMAAGVRTLNQMANAFQPRIEESTQLIGRIGDKSDIVDDGVRMNRAKLDAILKK